MLRDIFKFKRQINEDKSIKEAYIIAVKIEREQSWLAEPFRSSFADIVKKVRQKTSRTGLDKVMQVIQKVRLDAVKSYTKSQVIQKSGYRL